MAEVFSEMANEMSYVIFPTCLHFVVVVSNASTRGSSASFLIIQIRDSIVVSISACHAEDPGSIPGRGVLNTKFVHHEQQKQLSISSWPFLFT